MEKEVLIAIIGAISVMGAALFQSGLIPDLISNGDKEAGIAVIEKSIEPPKLTSFGPERDSPQKVGVSIRWTARAQDPDDETLYYKFLLMGPSTGGSWDAVQDWSTQSWWDWTPSKAGSYQVLVEVRDPEGNNNSMIKSYEIVEPVSEEENDDKEGEPPVLRSLKPDKTSPQVVGTAIKWTATAEDPDDTSLYYRFQLKGPFTDGYRVVQDRSTKDSWEWKPAEAGSYEVLVQVWDGDHAGPSESDDFRAVSYEIKETVAEKVVPAFFSEEDPAVAASSWGPGRLDLFVIGTDGALYHRYGGGSSWSVWERLGGEWVSAPAAVSWGPGRIDVFALGNDSALWHIWGDGSTWSDWESLGGNWTSAPAVSSAGENSMNVFVRGKDNALWHIWWGWDESQSKCKWSSWGSFGGYLTSAPAAISRDQGHIDVFARGKDNHLIHRSYEFPTWSNWELLVDGSLNSAPTVSSPDNYTLDVYIRGEDNALYMNRWDGRQSEWGGWQTLGGKLTSAPAAVYSGSSRTDVFARGTDNTLVHKWWGAPKWDWNDFETIGKWP